jgi:hypothetical protein
MNTLTREQSFELWDIYWDQMEREWFKVEVLQDYSAEDDGTSLQTWKNGDKEKSIELIKSEQYKEWVDECRKKIDEGVKLTRVHIVKWPLTQYLEWELEHYKYVNEAKCGENIYLVDKESLGGIDIPKGDIMFFDDKVVINSYDEKGFMIAVTFFDENDDIKQFLNLREKLRELAIPLKSSKLVH